MPDLERLRTNGVQYQRSRRLRVTLLAAAALALAIAAGAFAYALVQAASAKAQLHAEITRHCLIDVAHDNRQRSLDLALIKADRDFIAELERSLPGADPQLHRMILATADRARDDLIARTADLPVKRDPANC